MRLSERARGFESHRFRHLITHVLIQGMGDVFVRRIGKMKPPVQLGGEEKDLKEKASNAILKVVWQPQGESKEASS